MFSQATAIVRLLLFVLWTLVMISPYALLTLLRWRYREMGRFYWRTVARVTRMTVRVHGTLATHRPLLCVSNHSSYMDIVVLGSVIPGVFVAKAEVSGWPGFGFLARLARTIFIDRKRSATGKAREEIQARLSEGDPLILFPEGTSNDGNRVYKFKSALFAVAEQPVAAKGGPEAELWVQPVSLAYTMVDGVPLGRAWRPVYAWYGDMDLAPHMFALLGFGSSVVDVILHEPCRLSDFANRKALSDHCYTLVARGVEKALTGRLDDPAALEAPKPATDVPATAADAAPSSGREAAAATTAPEKDAAVTGTTPVA